MLVGSVADAAGVELGEQVDGLAIGERAELSAGRCVFERGKDVEHRLRRFEAADVEQRAGIFAGGAAAAGGRTEFDGRGGGGAGDLHLKFVGALDEVFPGEGVGELGGELVVERDGIVVVDQDEVLADGELAPAFEDERVLLAAGNDADVEERGIVSGGRGVGGCIHRMNSRMKGFYSAQRMRSIVNGSGARTA